MRNENIERIGTYQGSRAWFRSTDLWVMGPARFHCATLLDAFHGKKNTKRLSEVGFEPTPSDEDQNAQLSIAMTDKDNLESGALDRSAILTCYNIRTFDDYLSKIHISIISHYNVDVLNLNPLIGRYHCIRKTILNGDRGLQFTRYIRTTNLVYNKKTFYKIRILKWCLHNFFKIQNVRIIRYRIDIFNIFNGQRSAWDQLKLNFLVNDNNKEFLKNLTNQGHNFELSNRGARQVTIHTSKHNDIQWVPPHACHNSPLLPFGLSVEINLYIRHVFTPTLTVALHSNAMSGNALILFIPFKEK
ncbi:hypothetical protein AGLY_010712 [Aphis glycines]|uniref:Uncharacterized protein n=1 Tax=Aphis glycines TaxID=307491 RepID=A0A6G0TED0_APHGL|nr:hypothetical protein AGLY_010712 [Aphis glycines]